MEEDHRNLEATEEEEVKATGQDEKPAAAVEDAKASAQMIESEDTNSTPRSSKVRFHFSME